MLNQRFAIVLVAVGIVTSFAVAQQQRDSGGKPLAEFLQEREEALSEIVRVTRIQHKDGEVSWESLIAAEDALLDAQFDSATTTQERIAIREKQLRLATQLEDGIRRMVPEGLASPMELLQAKVSRLNAQIALLREQQIE